MRKIIISLILMMAEIGNVQAQGIPFFHNYLASEYNAHNNYVIGIG